MPTIASWVLRSLDQMLQTSSVKAALAVELWAEGLDLGLTIHPHPTLGEGMMEAAKHALGEAIHIANKK